MPLTGLNSLDVYKNARELRNEVFEIVKQFPSEETYRLKDQILRSSRKCPANIAEGYGRYHYQERIQYCRVARASLIETIEHLNCAFDCNYIQEKLHQNLTKKIEELIRMINGYIEYLQRRKRENKP